mgnify:CR=1 FL=1
MNMVAYYRTENAKLGAVDIKDVANVIEAKQRILKFLHVGEIHYFLPILFLIQGGNQ